MQADSGCSTRMHLPTARPEDTGVNRVVQQQIYGPATKQAAVGMGERGMDGIHPPILPERVGIVKKNADKAMCIVVVIPRAVPQRVGSGKSMMGMQSMETMEPGPANPDVIPTTPGVAGIEQPVKD